MNISSSGVAYIKNKDGAVVAVRHIAELLNTHTLNGEKDMQYFWALRIPAIANSANLHELVGETQMLNQTPHIIQHFDNHYAYWRKRGILSEYKTIIDNSDKE